MKANTPDNALDDAVKSADGLAMAAAAIVLTLLGLLALCLLCACATPVHRPRSKNNSIVSQESGWQRFCDWWGHEFASFQAPLVVDLKSTPPEIVLTFTPILINRDNVSIASLPVGSSSKASNNSSNNPSTHQ